MHVNMGRSLPSFGRSSHKIKRGTSLVRGAIRGPNKYVCTWSDRCEEQGNFALLLLLHHA